MGYKVFNEANYLYFATCTITEWIPIFISIPYFQIIIDSLKFCRANKGLKLNAYVIMPNHIHLIVQTEPGVDLSDVMRDFKRFTSREISKQLETDNQRVFLEVFAKAALSAKGNTKYKIWQDEFHPEAIYSEQFYKQKVDYLHDNPCRKGFVASPQDWLYSSARNYYLGDDSIIEIDNIII
jgi:REP element-mobilizing transposase RayT